MNRYFASGSGREARKAVLRRHGFCGNLASVPVSVLVQLAFVVVLVSFSTMLVAVGAFGSGVVGLVGSGVWLWRLYRHSGI